MPGMIKFNLQLINQPANQEHKNDDIEHHQNALNAVFRGIRERIAQI